MLRNEFRLATIAALIASFACISEEQTRTAEPDFELWSVPAEARVTIGVTEGPEPYLFQRIAAARLIQDGSIVVADRGHAVLRVFAADGSFVTEMGGSGEGPGEFAYIVGLTVSGPDTLNVYDAIAYRLTRFLTDGTLVGTRTVLGEDGFPEIFLGRFSTGDIGIAWIRQGASQPGWARLDHMQIGRFAVSGRLEALLASGSGLRGSETGMAPFTPRFHGLMRGDSVYFTDGLRPELSGVDATGSLLPTITLPGARLSSEEAVAALRSELERRENQELLDNLDKTRVDSVPAIAEVILDDLGRFWVKEYQPRTDSQWLGGWAGAKGGRWWVVGVGGEVHARVDLPDDLILLDVRGDDLLGMTRDDLGVERVVLYSLLKPGVP